MRFLLVDAITDVGRDGRITGVKNASISEDYFTHHFPQRPIVPGMLILESVVQLARWLTVAESDFTTTLLLSGVRQAKFRDFAGPGDQLVVEVVRTGETGGEPEFTGTVRVRGRKTATVTLTCRTVPLAELEDPMDAKHLYEILRSNGERTAAP